MVDERNKTLKNTLSVLNGKRFRLRRGRVDFAHVEETLEAAKLRDMGTSDPLDVARSAYEAYMSSEKARKAQSGGDLPRGTHYVDSSIEGLERDINGHGDDSVDDETEY
jgi:hypothetical protein